ncbi:unnamed protein product [Spirodela intermedia]|uniref:Uncharacterized protein n=1 Tax=Spirodela intermedia TaxID=51605 RepID=A0ABN7EBZ5_SPIIN|nr:unnamed protein product [Spirodela intermedia]
MELMLCASLRLNSIEIEIDSFEKKKKKKKKEEE